MQVKSFCFLVFIAFFLQSFGFDARAQNYPNKVIYILVGAAPGGGSDTAARLIAPRLSQYLAQPVIVDNRVGAGGAIANERVAKSPADGYTLLLMSSNSIITSALRKDLPYDLLRDLAPISIVSTAPQVVVVHPSVPARSIKELIALARSQPGKLNYGSTGIGSTAHLGGELLNLMAKIKLTHVPYKGSADSVVANAAGEIDINIPSISPVLPLLEAGKLRALGVTSLKRSAFISAVPTLDESGLPGYDYTAWWGVLAPAATPKNIIAQLNAALVKASGSQDMKDAAYKQSQEPQSNTPEQFAAFIRNELAQTIKLVKVAGMKPE